MFVFVIDHFWFILLFVYLYRLEDDHQRFVALVPSISRGHDSDHILSDGFRTVCPPSVHGRVEEQMRQDQRG